MARNALPCIACGRELRNVTDDVEGNQPYLGTAFMSHGHYGSTAFDPMNGFYLELNICDLCLVLHADRVMQGRDYRLVMEEGVVTGTENLDPPWKLVRWHVESKELDHVLREARDEWHLAANDFPEDVLERDDG